jgi:hypothetical protein
MARTFAATSSPWVPSPCHRLEILLLFIFANWILAPSYLSSHTCLHKHSSTALQPLLPIPPDLLIIAVQRIHPVDMLTVQNFCKSPPPLPPTDGLDVSVKFCYAASSTLSCSKCTPKVWNTGVVLLHNNCKLWSRSSILRAPFEFWDPRRRKGLMILGTSMDWPWLRSSV